MNIEAGSIIRPGVNLGTGSTVKCGAILGTNVTIGKNTYIGPGAVLLHMFPDGESKPCKIGNNCFIGANATICPGVEIVDSVTIGAGSVVTRSIMKPGIYVGNPIHNLKYKTGKYCIIDEPISIGKDVFIANYVHIRPNVEIGDKSEIRDYCFLAEGCKIGKNTRIMQKSNIGSDTVIGDNCFIGVGVITTNDREITYPKPANGYWKKEPPIIEDNVRIGSGALILPGVTIKEGTRIGAGAIVANDTESGKTYICDKAKING